MTTTAIKTTPVETKWNLTQVQEGAARAQANLFLAAMTFIAKQGEEAHKEFASLVRAGKVEYYKSLGVNTPIQLAKAIAEFETNVFGSKVEVGGDDHQAQIVYNQCAMWNAIEKHGKLTPAQQEKFGTNFQSCMTELGREFGLKSEVCMGEPCCTVTFTK
jgi:hypothetical protein